MGKSLNEESERMMLLLQELAAVKKTGSKRSIDLKRRKEISREMKRLAAQKKANTGDEPSRNNPPNL